jgi:hypothetical protein
MATWGAGRLLQHWMGQPRCSGGLVSGCIWRGDMGWVQVGAGCSCMVGGLKLAQKVVGRGGRGSTGGCHGRESGWR